MEATGAPIVSDGEQRASSFATYPLTDTPAAAGLAEHLAGGKQVLHLEPELQLVGTGSARLGQVAQGLGDMSVPVLGGHVGGAH